MLIQRNEVIADMPATDARDVARALQSASGTVDSVAYRLRIDPTAALRRLEALESAGLAERVALGAGLEQPWRATVSGNALAKARIGKPMPRAKGETLLERVLAEVAAVNADPDELIWIDVVYLFGSLADSSRDEVGDIDLHVITSYRDDEPDFERRRHALVSASSRQFGNILDVLDYPISKVRTRLRLNSPKIDLQLDTPGRPRELPDGAIAKEVFRREGCKPEEDDARRRGPTGEVLTWTGPTPP